MRLRPIGHQSHWMHAPAPVPLLPRPLPPTPLHPTHRLRASMDSIPHPHHRPADEGVRLTPRLLHAHPRHDPRHHRHHHSPAPPWRATPDPLSPHPRGQAFHPNPLWGVKMKIQMSRPSTMHVYRSPHCRLHRQQQHLAFSRNLHWRSA